eukprot:jgi/Chlat1/1476/Chrsp12S02019
MAAAVLLHVYDVTNSASGNTNAAIVHLNRLMRDGVGLGGVFHGGIEVYGEEWSFGYCERGTGVFCTVPTKNPMYSFRETVPLGMTALTQAKVKEIVTALSVDWQGCTYDLLARNCNHFCNELCEKLGVAPIPAWVNRLANGADATLDMVGTAVDTVKQLSSEVSSGFQSMCVWLRDAIAQPAAPALPSNSAHELPPLAADGSSMTRSHSSPQLVSRSDSIVSARPSRLQHAGSARVQVHHHDDGMNGQMQHVDENHQHEESRWRTKEL